MEIKEAYKNDKFKVLHVSLKKGEKMPLHAATSDAYIVNKSGVGRVCFNDREVLLTSGETLLINAKEPHQLDILEDFTSSVILESDATIDFI